MTCLVEKLETLSRKISWTVPVIRKSILRSWTELSTMLPSWWRRCVIHKYRIKTCGEQKLNVNVDNTVCVVHTKNVCKISKDSFRTSLLLLSWLKQYPLYSTGHVKHYPLYRTGHVKKPHMVHEWCKILVILRKCKCASFCHPYITFWRLSITKIHYFFR